MDIIERRMADLILDKLRVWDPSLGDADLDRPIAELDLDSLDQLEITQLLEREFKVKADLKETSGFAGMRDYITYFKALTLQ